MFKEEELKLIQKLCLWLLAKQMCYFIPSETDKKTLISIIFKIMIKQEKKNEKENEKEKMA